MLWHLAVMDPNDWGTYTRVVVRKMREHTRPYVASISRMLSSAEGELEGSGAYLQLRKKPYLITNAHVAEAMRQYPLAHLLADNDYAIRITNPFQACLPPIDAAISRIDERVWTSANNENRALPVGRLALKHSPVQRELFFLMGFSGERSHFSPSFETLFSPGTPYLTRECLLPAGWSGEIVFALHYPSEAVALDGDTRGLPAPPGLSGSLVWNTRAVECLMANSTWEPELSLVSGLLRLWSPRDVCLVATRIEYVRSFILHALRQEAAYFHWLAR